MLKTINGAMFANMVISGSKLLEVNRTKIDALNVFPVPDGDTGTNMCATLSSAVKELKTCHSNRLSDICDTVSRACLRGARGNSGVITSQIMKGLCKCFRDLDEISVKDFVKAMKAATDTAYAAVNKPKEGTILTVCRMMSACASTQRGRDILVFFENIIAAGEEALASTPELLPVLKKAGVVDSGGMGLVTIIKGMFAALKGEEISDDGIEKDSKEEPLKKDDHIVPDLSNLSSIQYAYCTEFFIINLKKKTTLADIDRLSETLNNIGDSVICVGDLELVKVHVHTNAPGIALTKALQLGELDKVKIENMLEQNRSLQRKYEAERKPIGLISVAQGEGLVAMFKELNCDRVIEGGQTMNPSASDIADAVLQVNASTIFVFPNNKNIILAAEQSKSLVEGRKIIVVPTKNIPQGLAAAMAYDPDAPADENLMNMLHAIDSVSDGQVTYAVRNTTVGGFSLKKGDYIGLNSKRILSKGTTINGATLKLIEKLKDKSHSLINIYYGADVKEQDAMMLKEEVEAVYPDCDVECYYGGQAVYYYILSLE